VRLFLKHKMQHLLASNIAVTDFLLSPCAFWMHTPKATVRHAFFLKAWEEEGRRYLYVIYNEGLSRELC
jgi:hypothetical protein